jgi:rhamnulose-1-phosphate aldolase
MMGEAGRHLAEIEASEGAAGNVSVCLRWPMELRSRFPVMDDIDLPQAVPELAGATFLVSGSGRRLREIIDEPTANIICIRVDEGGRTGKIFTSYHRRFEQVTSEFNSHLCAHTRCFRGTNFHALFMPNPCI